MKQDPDCNEQCPYLTFGEECQGRYGCDDKICDVSTGCPTNFITSKMLSIEELRSSFMKKVK